MRVAINKARVVLKFKPVLAQEVLSGMLGLDPDEIKQVDPIETLRQRRPSSPSRPSNCPIWTVAVQTDMPIPGAEFPHLPSRPSSRSDCPIWALASSSALTVATVV